MTLLRTPQRSHFLTSKFQSAKLKLIPNPYFMMQVIEKSNNMIGRQYSQSLFLKLAPIPQAKRTLIVSVIDKQAYPLIMSVTYSLVKILLFCPEVIGRFFVAQFQTKFCQSPKQYFLNKNLLILRRNKEAVQIA